MLGWLIDNALSVFNIWVLLALLYPFYRWSIRRERKKGGKE